MKFQYNEFQNSESLVFTFSYVLIEKAFVKNIFYAAVVNNNNTCRYYL